MVANLVAETVALRHAEPDDLSGHAPTGRAGYRSPRRRGRRHRRDRSGRPQGRQRRRGNGAGVLGVLAPWQ